MSQQVKVMRAIDFQNQGSGAVVQTIDCDTHANIIYWKPTTTDTGAIYFGDGTTDLDVKIFLGSTTEYVLFDVGNSRVGFACPVVPATSDGAALGTTALMFSDLFLASASVINFNAGDVTITHGSDLLTIAGGGLTMGASGTPAGDLTLWGTTALHKVWFDVNGDTNGAFYFGANDYGLDVGFYGQTINKSMVWDASADALVFTGAGLTMGSTGAPAGDFTLWGTQALAKVWFDVNGDTNGAFYFGADDYGLDVAFYGQTTANSMIWDASANALVLTAGGITMGVTSKLVLPVKASGSATNGDIWVDTTSGGIHFYYNAELYVTATAV